MTIVITPLYALPLAALMMGLVLRVVVLRRRLRVGIGTGGEHELAKAVRAHGNAAETIPLAILLLLLAESAGVGAAWLHAAGSVLVAGRVAHAYGLSTHAGASPGRVAGMVATIVVIVALAVLAAIQVL